MADEPGINFKKIVENVLSYLVTAVFLGACAIVWRGATTVDDRVHATEKNLQVLIDNLSAKLSGYELQLIAQSNQIAAVDVELKTRSTNWAALRAAHIAVAPVEPVSRAAIQQNIQQQLQMAK